jgi:Kef-type K+ transport system membrane component KefB
MQNVWVLASLWVGLALVATLLAIWFKISTALTEIVVGTVAQLIVGAFVMRGGLAAKSDWITFLAGTAAIVLTFLAGAELDPTIFRAKWKESSTFEETEIENDFQKKCRKGAKFAAPTAFSAILGEISCLFSLALECFTRFRGGSFQPLTHLSGNEVLGRLSLVVSSGLTTSSKELLQDFR